MSVTTWVEGAQESLYGVENLPYGVFSGEGSDPRVGVRIGEYVLDLAAAARADMAGWVGLFEAESLNRLMAAGSATWAQVRRWVSELLTQESERGRVEPWLVSLEQVRMHLPVAVGDYVDFYCSLDHATNVGRMFRPDEEALKPNWRHLPVGYHGRAGTVVASGAAVPRPSGQWLAPGASVPTYGPSQRLDIEAELAFVVGTPSPRGEQVRTEEFAEHVFGVAPLNDWSARDLQAWEYVPLGPFLGKSFATSISAWVTPLQALAAARVDLPGQDPEPLEYLRVGPGAGYDIDFEIELNGEVISRPPYAGMYWSPAQMLAHMSVNGASLRTGDLFASGTISGRQPTQRGSLLELSWAGKQPFTAGGRPRTFLDDGDTITLRATAPGANGTRIALGDVTGTITPAPTR